MSDRATPLLAQSITSYGLGEIPNAVLEWFLRIAIVIAIGCCICVEPVIMFGANDAGDSPIWALAPLVVAVSLVLALLQSHRRRWFFISGGLLSWIIIVTVGWEVTKMLGEVAHYFWREWL
jgi:hypothetical protein